MTHLKKLLFVLLVLFQGMPMIHAQVLKTTRLQNKILCQLANGQLAVEFINPEVIRVQCTNESDFVGNGTDMCVSRTPEEVAFTFSDNEKTIVLQSEKLNVEINKLTTSICYFDKSGKLLLAENQTAPRTFEKVNVEKVRLDTKNKKVEKTADGEKIRAEVIGRDTVGHAWRCRQQFTWANGEALFGLGCHEEDYMNLRGKMQYLYQHNLKKSVPVLMSSVGYGLLFDVGSSMIFHDDFEGSFFLMNAVYEVDYYFMYGPQFDQIVSHYRTLTGKVQMMPKYVFGYTQSKERYTSPHEIDSVLTRFRTEKIPLDMIVQDWNYWKPGWWGHKKFDENFYPNPDEMIRKVHQNNAHYMLSIWPTMNGNEGTEMASKGFLVSNSIYDAYNPAARKMYWDEYVNKNLFSKGVDAWWCDASEPIDGDWNDRGNAIVGNLRARYLMNTKPLEDGLGLTRTNTFSLHHAQGIYENQRLLTDKKRVVNLTRSGFAGLQRYGTFVWNGDTKATWADFAQWIPSGLNYMATGCPYWTIDAGAFFVKSRAQWFGKGAFDKGTDDMAYREFYVRNVQFCEWLPMFRSHGTEFAREPWQFGKKGEPFYESILQQINLRYRLLPYTYSVAAMVAFQDYTMTRMLAFDFMDDANVYNIKDQFMFGPAIMACPVTKPIYYDVNSKELKGVNKTRSVYLPKNTNWIDFWTGKKYQGGITITADAPIEHIPVFVRAGAIVPMSPVQQYASEMPGAPYEIRIYPGENGSFTIYEDEGDNYNYEQGKSANIVLQWDDKNKMLTIGDRQGSFDNMVVKRNFRLVLVGEGHGVGYAECQNVDKIVKYTGKKLNVAL
ncbi:MAG: glycoside hydrolase family 31 protein [Bacteroidota bacterium]|nr:glycoside hydrolase family 31 protein [Bacteroidota bacterium]